MRCTGSICVKWCESYSREFSWDAFLEVLIPFFLLPFPKSLPRLKEVVEWPLKHSQAIARLGAATPRGVLLHGPPGVNKCDHTYLFQLFHWALPSSGYKSLFTLMFTLMFTLKFTLIFLQVAARPCWPGLWRQKLGSTSSQSRCETLILRDHAHFTLFHTFLTLPLH